MNCLIIDDEPLAHVVLESYISKITYLSLVGNCYHAVEALNFLHQHQIDILFLDIEMPELSGLEMLATLQNPPAVILTTAYSHFALESYDYQVVDYLLKPIRFERFLKAIHRAMPLKDSPSPTLSTTEEKPNYIWVKIDNVLQKIDIQEINYIEAYGNFVKIYVANKYHLTAETLANIQKNLLTFLQVHRSYVVNIHFVEKVNGNRLIMKDKTEIPIGSSYKQVVMNKLK